MKLRELAVGQKFHFPDHTLILEYRGEGWFGRPGGNDGGPWSDSGSDPNPVVIPEDERIEMALFRLGEGAEVCDRVVDAKHGLGFCRPSWEDWFQLSNCIKETIKILKGEA